MKLILSIYFILTGFYICHSQIESVAINLEGEIEFPSQFLQLKSSIASRIDSRNPNYLYSANLIFGLGIYDISDPSAIDVLLEMEVSEFDGLSVSTIQQVGDLLYVGLGDFQSENPATGLAILDVTNPESPTLIDIWTSENFINGLSHLDIYDGIVYLSVMNDGLLMLDVSDESDIQFVSHFVPDLKFPAASEGHHQGRGITKVDDVLYYTFDRGGLRSIDVSDIYQPKEIEQYINADLIEKATAAYNDVLVVGDRAYVSVDYCGLEVLDISTSPWTLIEWYDPVDCQGFNWFGAEVHTNELVTACNDSLLFVSGGNSEVIVFDISNPSELRRVGDFFELDNELAAYGLHIIDDKISVSYINNPLNVPYVGNWGGLKILSYSKMKTTSTSSLDLNKEMALYPNPASTCLQIENYNEASRIDVFSMDGNLISVYKDVEIQNGQIRIDHLERGHYILKLISKDSQQHIRFVKI